MTSQLLAINFTNSGILCESVSRFFAVTCEMDFKSSCVTSSATDMCKARVAAWRIDQAFQLRSEQERVRRVRATGSICLALPLRSRLPGILFACATFFLLHALDANFLQRLGPCSFRHRNFTKPDRFFYKLLASPDDNSYQKTDATDYLS